MKQEAPPGPTEPRAPRVLRNAVVLSSSSLTSLVLYGATSVIVAQFLGREHLGRYAAAVASAQMLAGLADLGISTVLLRELSRKRSPEEVARYLDSSVRLRLRLAAVAYLLLVGLVLAMDYPPAVRQAALIFGGTTFVGILATEIQAIIRAWERMELDALVGVSTAALNFALSYLVLSAGYGIRALACVAVLVSLLSGAALLFLCHRFVVRVGMTRALELDGPLLRAAWPVGLGGLMYGLYDRLDILFLWKFTSPGETGVYSVAYQLLGIGKLLVGAVASAVIPSLSSLAHPETRAQLLSTTNSTVRMMSVVGATYVLAAWVLADPVVLTFFGPSYHGAADLLRILAVSAGVIAVGTVFGNLLVACEVAMGYLFLSGLGLACNFGLNALLVPLLGARGAAWSTLATDLIASLVAFAMVCRHLGYVPVVAQVARTALLTAATALAWQRLAPPEHPLLSAAVTLAVFPLLLFATGAVNKNELRIVAQLVRRKGPRV